MNKPSDLQAKRILGERVIREACDFIMWEREATKAAAGDAKAAPNAATLRDASKRRLEQAVAGYKGLT